ncbi:FkbM family methyltransferase [Pedobacter agri]|uniref:FkbM family methyltransferase n=1 Tax=Pedobacter agri TaxID=454586 RepID=UPI00292D81DF|nr:FkbM family methyltransferase [Pedobacter agri]
MLAALKRTFGFIHQHPLAKRNLLHAYFNFIKWQITSRLNKNLVKVPFIESVSFYAKKRLTGITGNIYTGLHEFNDMGFLLHFLRKEDLFYDIGANVGSYTLLAAGICKSNTVAFEPISETFEILSQNMKLNHFDKLVITENMGVGDKIGELYFSTDSDTTNHVINSNEDTASTAKVPVINLDSYYQGYPPNLIKIDVEGYEGQVLDGASELLSAPGLKAIIIEIIGGANFYGSSNSNVHQKLTNHKFSPHNYDPFTRNLTPSEPNSNCNTIYIRDVDFVFQRVTCANHFTIFGERI